MKNSSKTTIYDIASAAGSSPSTVSSALNGTWKSRRIKPETVERIKRIADDHGYSVNLQARGLRKSESGLVGMVLPEHDNRFFSSLSQSFSTQARSRGHFPIIISSRRHAQEEQEAVENLLSLAIDSLFIVGASKPDQLSLLCTSKNIPHVFVDQPGTLASSVLSDNRHGAKQLAQHLLGLMPKGATAEGHGLYFLGGDATLFASAERIKGYQDALVENDLTVDPAQIIACGYDRDVAANELRALHERLGALPSGLLVNSIHCLEGALSVLSQIPEPEIRKCSIGCYDYEPLGRLLRFPVTMIRQRANKLIETAYGIIDSEQTEPERVLIKPELIESIHSGANQQSS